MKVKIKSFVCGVTCFPDGNNCNGYCKGLSEAPNTYRCVEEDIKDIQCPSHFNDAEAAIWKAGFTEGLQHGRDENLFNQGEGSQRSVATEVK